MSKGVLSQFYHSPMWKRTRRLYLERQHFICERCGQPGTLVHHKQYLRECDVQNLEKLIGFDNLECLCVDCHAKEHAKRSATREGITFDKDGNLIVMTDAR